MRGFTTSKSTFRFPSTIESQMFCTNDLHCLINTYLKIKSVFISTEIQIINIECDWGGTDNR